MTLKTRIKQLEEEQEERDARNREQCICEIVIIEDGQPTPEQEAVIARNATCRAHARELEPPATVVEVPPMPEWMKTGEQRPPRESED